MRKEYETPEITVEKFTVYDVTTASEVTYSDEGGYEF